MRAALAAACLLALAQNTQPPAFRSGVSLVTVDVTVLDADGRPVPGLSATDFEIRLNNRVQPIRGLDYLQIGEAMAGAVGPSFDAAPIGPAGKGPVRAAPRVLVLLVDDLAFSPLAGKELLAAAARFVASLPSTDLVGLTTSTGTSVVNATTERAPILAALPKITGAFQDPRFESSGPAEGKNESPDQQIGLAQALDIDRGDSSVLKQAIINECFGGDTQAFSSQTLEQLLGSNTCARQVQLSAMRSAAQMKMTVQRQAQAYESVIRAMKSATGIRQLVVLTDGVALSQDVTTMTPVARAAAEAGVQLTVIMATPDISLSDGGRRPQSQSSPGSQATRGRQVDTGAPQRRREDNAMLLNGARTTADMAGGDFYQVTGDPDRFFERVATAGSAVYRIAVEAPPETTPGRDFTLVARVPKQPRLTIRANRHAVAAARSTATAPPGVTSPAPTALVAPEEQMKRAIASGRALQGLDAAIEHTIRRAADPSQLSIDVVVRLGALAKPPVSTIFALVDAAGAIRASNGKFDAPPDADGYHAAFSVPVSPGAYTLRFAAADASGAVGSVQSAVDATLTKIGPLLASGLRVEWLPGQGRTLLASLELYPSGEPPPGDVLVKMALLSPAMEPVVERVIVPEAADGVLRAEAEFACDRLPAGAYTVRATVLSGANVLGTIARAVK